MDATEENDDLNTLIKERQAEDWLHFIATVNADFYNNMSSAETSVASVETVSPAPLDSLNEAKVGEEPPNPNRFVQHKKTSTFLPKFEVPKEISFDPPPTVLVARYTRVPGKIMNEGPSEDEVKQQTGEKSVEPSTEITSVVEAEADAAPPVLEVKKCSKFIKNLRKSQDFKAVVYGEGQASAKNTTVARILLDAIKNIKSIRREQGNRRGIVAVAQVVKTVNESLLDLGKDSKKYYRIADYGVLQYLKHKENRCRKHKKKKSKDGKRKKSHRRHKAEDGQLEEALILEANLSSSNSNDSTDTIETIQSMDSGTGCIGFATSSSFDSGDELALGPNLPEHDRDKSTDRQTSSLDRSIFSPFGSDNDEMLNNNENEVNGEEKPGSSLDIIDDEPLRQSGVKRSLISYKKPKKPKISDWWLKKQKAPINWDKLELDLVCDEDEDGEASVTNEQMLDEDITSGIEDMELEEEEGVEKTGVDEASENESGIRKPLTRSYALRTAAKLRRPTVPAKNRFKGYQIYEIPNDNSDFFQSSFSLLDRQFLQAYHVSKETLAKLIGVMRGSNGRSKDLLRLKADRQHHVLIPFEKQIGISMYALASGLNYNVLAKKFQVSKTAIRTCLTNFVNAFLEKLQKSLIYCPIDGAQYNAIRNGFHELSSIPPTCVGVFAHCDLTEKMNNIEGAEQRRVFVTAWVDDKMQFRNVEVSPNIMMMGKTINLAERISALEPFVVDEYRMPCFLATSFSTYKPFRPWLIQPFEQPDTLEQKDFNGSMNRVVDIGNEAFLHLLGRWQILFRNRHVDRKTFQKVVLCCCCLHNLMLQLQEPYMRQWHAKFDPATIFNITKKSKGCSTSAPQYREASAARDTLALITSKFAN